MMVVPVLVVVEFSQEETAELLEELGVPVSNPKET